MLRGLYTAAAGMVTQQRRHDTVTHNISNLQTPGYKQQTSVARTFPEMLVALKEKEQDGLAPKTTLGRLSTGVFAEESIPAFQQGDLIETGHSLDFALYSQIEADGMVFDASGKYVDDEGTVTVRPQAFFTVQGRDGEALFTRDGRFTVSAAGELTTSEGYRVLNENGEPIVLIDPDTDLPVQHVHLDASGMLRTRDGQPLGQLRISRVERPHLLVPAGNNMLRAVSVEEAGITTTALSDQVSVRQGFVEQSNVDAGQAMVELTAALRAYEANQKVIQAYDRSLDKAVNEVGRV